MNSEIQPTEYGSFPSNFRCSKLSELCAEKIGVQTGPFGSQLHKEDYVQVGTPIITVEHLGDNRIIHINTPFVSDEDRIRLSKYHLQEGDIVFSRVGSVDRRAIVRKEENGWLFSGRCLRVRADKEKIDPLYLSYFFGLEAFKKYIRGIAVGATMPSINTKILSDISIYYPESLEAQREIATTFYAIDEKIEINSKSNQTLEAIAQTLFKSWFVDFDPVKAKLSVLAAGGSAEEAERAAMCAISARDEASLNTLQTEQPEAYAELARTAALFPSAMQDSELGEMPMGWELSEIGKEVKIVGGGTPSTKQPDFWDNGDICWTTPKDLSNATDKIILDTERKITKEGLNKISSGLLPVNTVLLSSRAPVGYLALTKVPLAINQGYIAMRCEQNLPPEYVLLWASSVMDEIKQRASGTTFAEISKKNFKPINVVVPSKALLDIFTQHASNIYDQIANQVSENSSLTRVRDTLLPKLLSGELTLPDTTPPKANPPESDTLEGQQSQQPLMEAAG
ncbi:restriction endonuclease subunit S [Endozoicomonas sp. ONNA2]|uniref:restriction endonuclease subunit S n=1 Tax=Endozoicomonas sp. ONNA2 TaxID=2828741 RepID=UPI002147342C|nr:restriction endonuclease subunit S [Endozoicomonas sp. ONNA2]